MGGLRKKNMTSEMKNLMDGLEDRLKKFPKAE